MHKIMCSRCLQRISVIIPSSPNRSFPCSHVRPYSRWFALYEDVTPVEVPISELPPSSSSYSHGAPIGLNEPSSMILRRSMSSSLVPTLEDSSELGGHDIVDEEVLGSVLGVSTGYAPSTFLYDFDSLLANVEESNLELPKLGIVPSRDLLPVSSLRGSSPNRKTVKNIPEKEGVERSNRTLGVRSRLVSISSASVASVIPPRVEQMEAVEIEPEVDPIMTVREGEMNEQLLMDIIKSSGMDGLRYLLSESFWPKGRLSPTQVSTIFTLVVDQAKDCEECREIMRDFACASPRHFLPSHIPLLLAARSAREEGVQRALQTMSFHHKTFILAPISLGVHSSRRSSAARSMWKEVAKRSKKEDIDEIYESGMRMGLLDGSREMVEETLKVMLINGASFSSIFREWKEMGERYGNRRNGLSTVVRAAMEEDGHSRRESLISIGSFVCTSPTLRMESFVAHLVLNLLWSGEEKAAKHVFSLVSIHGKHWMEILGEMERDQSAENLILVEKIANLITYGVIGEIRKKKKKSKANEEIDEAGSNGQSQLEEMKRVEEKDELSIMMEMIVWKSNGGKNDQRKNNYKKTKKRAKVNETEVHELALRIQQTWHRLENEINGQSSEGMTRLAAWSSLHRLSIPHSIPSLMNEKKMVKRESGV